MDLPFGNLERTLMVVDIETVRRKKHIDNKDLELAWTHHCKGDKYPNIILNDSYRKHAGLFPEFGFICALSLGYLTEAKSFSIKSWKAKNQAEEKHMLQEFAQVLNSQCYVNIIGHTIKTYDIPWIVARMVAHQIKVPNRLVTYNVALHHSREYITDIREVWTGGIHNTCQSKSLSSICFCLGVETPKDGIDGSQVGEYFWDKNDLDTIAKYCNKDVLATYHCYLKMKNSGII